MRISIDAAILAEELALVGRVIDKRTGSSLPVLGHVLLQAEGDRLILSATDMIIAMRTAVAATVKERGTALVPAEQFARFVQTWDGDLELAHGKDGWVELRCAGSKAKLPSLPAADYPTINTADDGGIEIDGPQLIALLRRTAYIARREEAHSPNSGYPYIRLSIADGVVSASATDGKRIAHSTAPAAGPGKVTALLPAKLGGVLIDQAERLTGPVYFRADEGRLFFWSGDLRLSSTVPYGGFPQLERLLPVPKDYAELTVSRGALGAALKRLAFIDPGGMVRCDIKDGAIKLSAKSYDHGQGEEALESSAKVSLPTIGLGIEFVASFVASAEGDELTLALPPKPDQPCHLWPTGRANEHHYIVAPRQA